MSPMSSNTHLRGSPVDLLEDGPAADEAADRLRFPSILFLNGEESRSGVDVVGSKEGEMKILIHRMDPWEESIKLT